MTRLAPVMIMAGGTGGHVYPALAVAACLTEKGVPVIWLGTRRGIEARVVPAAGIPMEPLTISGLRGKGWLSWLLAPMRLNLAIVQSFIFLWRHKPRAVLGMGGFVAGPGGVAAYILGVPLIVHEQNAVAGLTNRLLAPLCERLLSGFPDAFSRRPVTHTGNPVRGEIAALQPPGSRLAHRGGPLRLFVFGGSLGAQVFNELVPEALRLIPGSERPQVRHQTGRGKEETTRDAYAAAGVEASIQEFVEDMAEVYAWSDIVLCRAGAITVAELAAAGCGALLVPYPYAVDDHQTANARFLSDAGAAVTIPQASLTPTLLADRLRRLAEDRPRLLDMARAARDLARPEAANEVAEICLEAGGSGREGRAA